MVLPGTVLLGLQLIPASLRLGVLVGPLHSVPLAAEPGQTLQGGVWRGVAQRVAAFAGRGAADEQPFLSHRLIADGPDPPGSEVVEQLAALDGPDPDATPGR